VPIPTEPIGSIPRPRELIEGMEAFASGRIPLRELDSLARVAARRLELEAGEQA
jgi:methionine synthase II (cobalamin-independent)